MIAQTSRKVSKCGYLFVAPHDWDWGNPLYRTKVSRKSLVENAVQWRLQYGRRGDCGASAELMVIKVLILVLHWELRKNEAKHAVRWVFKN